MYNIKFHDQSRKAAIQHKIDNKTKPVGSLGQLEQLAMQIALTQKSDQLSINNPTMLVFAGDHGIASQGVSIAPSEVTTQMVATFLNGGAGINCFCSSSDMSLKVIDAGIKQELPDSPKLIKQRLGHGTNDFSTTAAMSLETAEQGLLFGAKQVEILASEGCNTVGFGEMGIGNTSATSAIMCALYSMTAEDCVGRGTGITDEQITRKRQLINQALTLHKDQFTSPLNILATVGGYEIAQITGGMLKAAEQEMLILVDGFIATAAAALATKMVPATRDYLVFCHHSEEQGHKLILSKLDAKPLLDLGLRLGEGTGAALALPIIRAACNFYNNMASFDEAGVTV